MRILLDTHALVWFYQADTQISKTIIAEIQNRFNEILVSPASYWEVAIKLSIQKPMIQVPFLQFGQEAIFDNGFKILSIEPNHTAFVATLPFHHKDPFDRLLAAQSLVENISIISKDAIFDRYGVRRLW